MKGMMVNYRGSRHRKINNQIILYLKEIKTKEEANTIIGKKIVYNCNGINKKQIIGIISNTHGNSGGIRAIFTKGLPGQAIGKSFTID